MSFDEYERSTAQDKFENYDQDNMMVVWLDLLGTRKLGHLDMVTRLNTLLRIATQASSLGPILGSTLIGTPQWLFQYAVVGDALVMAQKFDPAVTYATQLGLLKGALNVSENLFLQNIPHRASVSVGKVMCKIDNRAAIITGEAVLRAYFLESNLKTMGIYLDRSCINFCGWYKKTISQKDLNYAPIKYPGIATNLWSQIKPEAILVGNQGQHEAFDKYLSDNPRAKKVCRTKLLVKSIKL